MKKLVFSRALSTNIFHTSMKQLSFYKLVQAIAFKAIVRWTRQKRAILISKFDRAPAELLDKKSLYQFISRTPLARYARSTIKLFFLLLKILKKKRKKKLATKHQNFFWSQK